MSSSVATPTSTSAAPSSSSERVVISRDMSAFGGPLGGTLFMTLLPLLTIYLFIAIHHHGGALFLPGASTLSQIPIPTPRAFGIAIGWLAFQAALQVLLPARTVKGIPQRDGLRVEYRLNGLLSLIGTLALLFSLFASGALTGQAVLREIGPLLMVANLFAYALAASLYHLGLSSPRREMRTGHRLYDYFMGSALNPRIGKFDLKLFFESKIGMTTWIVIVLAMAKAEIEQRGQLSLAMGLVCAFQLFYVIDFYWFEEAMLSTWDINHENYGYMLSFGFVVWMPFTFSLQAQYLVFQSASLPIWAAVLIGIFNFAGYFIFRSANLQKHHFRTDPTRTIWGKPPEFMETKRGTRLLTSGFWGLARHTNYLGDLMMALAWCLPTGFGHIVPFFYFIYFAPLLIDRERRDHRACAAKYGEDWDRYCERVRYRILPGVY